MNIYTAEQIKAWDTYTIEHEPILSIDLMERAAEACVKWILDYIPENRPVHIFCGKGNNGGDGLAIARLLLQHQYIVDVYILEQGAVGTPDFQINLQRLHKCTHRIHFLQSEEVFPHLHNHAVVIDALFGLGLSRPVDGLVSELIRWINHYSLFTVSIDLPSGMFADKSSLGNDIVRADHTLSFQCWKQALYMEENASYTGEVHILPIGLHPGFAENESAWLQMITANDLKKEILHRQPFSHKGDYGHALLIAGSRGKMGAAIMAAKACLRSGAGLLTAHVSQEGYPIMQIAIPEAMVSVDKHAQLVTDFDLDPGKYDAIGAGPGLGTDESTAEALLSLIATFKKPMVLDADALNILSIRGMKNISLPAGSVLTPHPGEFERLYGQSTNHFERVNLALRKAKETGAVIIVKTRYSLIVSPDGRAWINPTGNAGMAKAGSGDVLTGIITGLLARGYEPVVAARLGVYIHGFSGDLAAAEKGQESVLAGDLIEFLPKALNDLYKG